MPIRIIRRITVSPKKTVVAGGELSGTFTHTGAVWFPYRKGTSLHGTNITLATDTVDLAKDGIIIASAVWFGGDDAYSTSATLKIYVDGELVKSANSNTGGTTGKGVVVHVTYVGFYRAGTHTVEYKIDVSTRANRWGFNRKTVKIELYR